MTVTRKATSRPLSVVTVSPLLFVCCCPAAVSAPGPALWTLAHVTLPKLDPVARHPKLLLQLHALAVPAAAAGGRLPVQPGMLPAQIAAALTDPGVSRPLMGRVATANGAR